MLTPRALTLNHGFVNLLSQANNVLGGGKQPWFILGSPEYLSPSDGLSHCGRGKGGREGWKLEHRVDHKREEKREEEGTED